MGPARSVERDSIMTAAATAGEKIQRGAPINSGGSKLLTGYNLTTPPVASRPRFPTRSTSRHGIMMQPHGVQSVARSGLALTGKCQFAVADQRKSTAAFLTVCQMPQRSGIETNDQARMTSTQLDREGSKDVSFPVTDLAPSRSQESEMRKNILPAS
jgi:hypothetical protein